MASGCRSGGVDFDDLFDPYVEGPYSQDTGRRIGGVDLSRRYAHIQYGSKGPDTGFRVNGVDVANLWAAKGTAVYSLPFNGKIYATHRGALTGENGEIIAIVSVSFYPDGTWSISSGTGAPTSGTWLPAGRSAAEYQILIETTGNTRATVINGAPSYTDMTASRGVQVKAVVAGNSADYINEAVSVTVRLRHSSGTVTSTSMSARVSVLGYL